MKIWDIVKSEFENQKNVNSNIEEGWREMALGGAMALSSLGAKASEKPLKPASDKIEYISSADAVNPSIIIKFKKEYVSMLAKRGQIFDRFDRNYQNTIQYISNLDVQTINDKIYVVDDRNKRTLIRSTGEDVNQQIYKIFGDYIVDYLRKNNEDKVGKSIYQEIQNEFSQFLQK